MIRLNIISDRLDSDPVTKLDTYIGQSESGEYYLMLIDANDSSVYGQIPMSDVSRIVGVG